MSDYIKRSDIPYRDLAEGHNTDVKVLVAFASDIAEIPSADVVERKRGEWQMTINQDYRCTACGLITSSYKANYCPNCGAMMKEVE